MDTSEQIILIYGILVQPGTQWMQKPVLLKVVMESEPVHGTVKTQLEQRLLTEPIK